MGKGIRVGGWTAYTRRPPGWGGWVGEHKAHCSVGWDCHCEAPPRPYVALISVKMHPAELELRRACCRALSANDGAGQPVVVSAADLLVSAPYARGLRGLRTGLLQGKSPPVMCLQPHPDVRNDRDKAANTLFTRCEPDQASAVSRLYVHEHLVRGNHEASAVVDTKAVAALLDSSAGTRSDRKRAVLAGTLGLQAAARLAHRPQVVIAASAAAATASMEAEQRAWTAWLEAECLRRGVLVDRCPPGVRRQAMVSYLRNCRPAVLPTPATFFRNSALAMFAVSAC